MAHDFGEPSKGKGKHVSWSGANDEYEDDVESETGSLPPPSARGSAQASGSGVVWEERRRKAPSASQQIEEREEQWEDPGELQILDPSVSKYLVRFQVITNLSLRLDDISQRLDEETVVRMEKLEAEQRRLSLMMEETINTLTERLEKVIERAGSYLTADQNSAAQRLECLETAVNHLSDKMNGFGVALGLQIDTIKDISGKVSRRPQAASSHPPATSHATAPVPLSPLTRPLSPLTPSTVLETLSPSPAPQGEGDQQAEATSASAPLTMTGPARPSHPPASEHQVEAASPTMNPRWVVTPPTPQRPQEVGKAPTTLLAPVAPSPGRMITRGQSRGHGVSSSDGAGTSASTGSQDTGKGQKRKAQSRAETAGPKKRK
ncbi:hypothetical protein BGW80DRAFT_1463355 [Lactifluus volemus]|nr:hypothetical protein BGW80DRAFT_1463355 [Lactifluus volemus]